MRHEEETLPAHWRIVQGHCLAVLATILDESIDAVITDPPYSSGGFTRDDKNREVAGKYQNAGTQRRYPAFSGDAHDQRSHLSSGRCCGSKPACAS